MLTPNRSHSFYSLSALLIIALSMVFWASRISNLNITSWDVLGYYSYLPQTFIEHDPGNANLEQLEKMRQKYDLGPPATVLYKTEKGYNLAQYSFGMAIFYLPAFATGHAVAHLSGYEADGYSPPYQYSLLWWQVFYMIMAFVVLRKTLKHFFDDRLTSMLMLAVCFGTNFYLYATAVYGMSHTYLFLTYTILLNLTIGWHQRFEKRYALGLGLTLGLMVITRPTELLACLIPLLWGIVSVSSFKEKAVRLWAERRSVLVLLSGFLFLPLLQMVYWKIYSGEFLYYGYRNPGEGFELLHPHLPEFLFSFKKGWFLYTPLMLVAVAAILLSLFRKKEYSLALVVFTCLNVYILSCWSNWWYSASYGSRAVIQSYPVYILGLGAAFHFLHRKKQMVLRMLPTVICILTIALNMFQAWQARHDILHPEWMTRKYYFAIFGRTSVPPGADTLLSVSHDHTLDSILQRPQRYFLKNVFVPGQEPGTSAKVNRFDTIDQSNRDITVRYDEMSEGDHAWVCIEMDYRVMDSTQLEETQLAFYFINKRGQGYGWTTVPLTAWSHLQNTWHHFKIYWLTPNIRLASDRFQTKILKPEATKLRVKNYTVKTYAPRE